MTHLRPACLITLLLASIASASAAPLAVSNGAYAGVYVRDCRTSAERAAGTLTPSLCNENTSSFGHTLVDMRYDANYGGLTASTMTINPLAAGSMGSVDASGTPGTLVLHQATFTTTSYARASSQVEAMQSFTWDGSGSSHRAIAGHVDFTSTYLTDSAGWWAAITTPASEVAASIDVFSLASGNFVVDAASPNRPDFAVQASTLPDFATAAASYYESVGAGGIDWTLDFDLVSGRTYFIDAWFGIWAKFGAGVDASHTFTATLGELNADGRFTATTDGLQLAAASNDAVHNGNTIPEPPAIALILLALGAIGVRRRIRD